MSARHIQVLVCYGAFVALSVLLALARRRLRPNGAGAGVWQKYPTYIVLNLVFLAAAWLPPRWHGLAILLAAIGAGAAWEICRALGLRRLACVALPTITAGLVLAAAWLAPATLLTIWPGVLLVALAAGTLVGPREPPGRLLIGLAGSVIYLPLCLAPLLWLWHLPDGGFRAVYFYLLIAGNDAFAQLAGQLFGRHRLAPQISPGKTVAGALGGLLCAIVIGVVLSSTLGWPVWYGAAVGAAIGVAGQIGDLVESSWKRALGIKDFSALLGAQGGVLDRFDALIFAVPVFYLLSLAAP